MCTYSRGVFSLFCVPLVIYRSVEADFFSITLGVYTFSWYILFLFSSVFYSSADADFFATTTNVYTPPHTMCTASVSSFGSVVSISRCRLFLHHNECVHSTTHSVYSVGFIFQFVLQFGRKNRVARMGCLSTYIGLAMYFVSKTPE